MKDNIKEAIQEYQCSGCVKGPFPSCFSKGEDGVGCGSHSAGTFLVPIGRIFLGLPKGFHRLGAIDSCPICMYDKFEDFINGNGKNEYSKFMVPTWKHKNKLGHTLVRVYQPRINCPIIHIFLEDCMDKINCIEITEEDIENMD